MKSNIISSVHQNGSGHEYKKRKFMVSKKLVLFILVFAFSNIAIAQNLNGYKYALVPSKFSYWKEKDKFKLNTLTKLFMQKYGFETYLDTETAPYDFLNFNCNKVYVDLIKNNGIFFTKLTIVLKDCNGNILFTSKEGSSKDKDYNVAYNEALRQAFFSFESLHHKYDEKIAIAEKIVAVKPYKEAIEEPKVVLKESKEVPTSTTETSNQLYAQPTQNGFQLVNSEPRVVIKLYKTSVKDFYTAIKGNLQGVFVVKNNEWFFEYYENEVLVSEKVAVKF